MSRLPNLKLLTTTGMHNAAIDLDAATELGILVCGAGEPEIPGQPPDMSDVVELTWGLILSLARHIPQEDAAVRKGRWQTSVGMSLKGKTLGILGLGNLGKPVAAIGRALGMSVIAWSKNLSQEAAVRDGAELTTRDGLFTGSDVLSIHLKLSDRTRGLIGKRELGLMKPTALLINTSRGPIVNEDALIEALINRSIGGAGLDVFEEEPLPLEHPFLSLDNVVLTPHIGYVAEDTYRSFFKDTVANILAYLDDSPVRVMNPGVRWKPAFPL
jgi:phosphoglycerate dehydrogenase-like enzyme